MEPDKVTIAQLDGKVTRTATSAGRLTIGQVADLVDDWLDEGVNPDSPISFTVHRNRWSIEVHSNDR